MCLKTYGLFSVETELKGNASRNTEFKDKPRVWQEAAKSLGPIHLCVLTAVEGPIYLCTHCNGGTHLPVYSLQWEDPSTCVYSLQWEDPATCVLSAMGGPSYLCVLLCTHCSGRTQLPVCTHCNEKPYRSSISRTTVSRQVCLASHTKDTGYMFFKRLIVNRTGLLLCEDSLMLLNALSIADGFQ